MTNFLIKNTTIVTLNNKNQILKEHSIAIKDGLIEKIGPKKLFKDCKYNKIINAKNKIAMPGFINTHTHFYSAFARGLYKIKHSSNFLDILKNLWWRLDVNLTLNDCYHSALIASIEAIKNGTTTVFDHHSSPNAINNSLNKIAQAVTKTGLRTCLSYELSNRNHEKCAQKSIEENNNFILNNINSKNSMLKAMFGLHASFTINNKTLKQAAKTSKAGFHIHVAESINDQKITKIKYNQNVVNRLEEFGILGPKTICAHCVNINDEEIGKLAKSNSIVVHNHQSNMNNAVGIAPINKFINAGILVGLGTDSMTYNMLLELKAAIISQNFASNNAAFEHCCIALLKNNQKIATRIFGQKIGQIKNEFIADIILIDYKPYTEFSSNSLYGHMVFGLSESQIDTTIINGKILMQNKKLLNLNEDIINNRALKLSAKLFEKFFIYNY